MIAPVGPAILLKTTCNFSIKLSSAVLIGWSGYQYIIKNKTEENRCKYQQVEHKEIIWTNLVLK